MPTIPHSAAGWRIEPPVSVPSAHGASPAPTAAALPPEEPPGTRSRSHGLRTGPKAEFSFEDPIANSSWLVLASRLAPAPVRRETTVAVYGGRYLSRIREPAWLGTPSVQKRSLTASGNPASCAAVADRPPFEDRPPASSGACSATQVKQLSPSPPAARLEAARSRQNSNSSRAD